MLRQHTKVEQGIVMAAMPVALVPVMVLGLTAGGCGETPAAVPAADAVSATHLPSGYALQLDRANRDRTDFVVQTDAGELVVETGPAGILYRPDDLEHIVGAGDANLYRVRGTFTQVGAPMGHREGFGIFIGGQHLGGDEQRYVYFLVRGDGRYLVKKRDGDATVELSSGWQSSEAVRVPTGDGGQVTNELAVEVDGGQLRLFCNGEPVAELLIGETVVSGQVGIRVNHNLHVRVGNLGIDR
jgi:hypothetical protein